MEDVIEDKVASMLKEYFQNLKEILSYKEEQVSRIQKHQMIRKKANSVIQNTKNHEKVK